MQLALAGVCAFLLSLLFTACVRAVTRHYGIVAKPRKDRWHQKPTAMLGGVGIYLAFVTAFALFAPTAPKAYPILAFGTFIFLAGFIDDLIQIKPYTKLSLQLIAAAGIVHFGLKLPWSGYETLNDIITMFWLVAITNAINLLDNMDGLAGGVSFIACVAMAAGFAANGQPAEAMVVCLLAGAVLGFLVFNFHPASIFMGDCGSMFLGLTLGATALLNDYSRTFNLLAVLLTPVLMFLIPIFDMCVVTITRKFSGRPVSQGGRDHTSHRLVALGMSERSAVLMLWLIAGCSGALALYVRVINAHTALLLVLAFALTIFFFGLHLGKVRIHQPDSVDVSNRFVNVLVEFSHKKRIFEVLLDLGLVTFAYYGSFLFRFGGDFPAEQLDTFVRTLPAVVLIQQIALLLGGVYRGVWRYFSVADVLVIAGATVAAAILSGVAVSAMTATSATSPGLGVFVIDGIILLALICTSRLSFRMLGTLISDRHRKTHPEATPILIYGAGDGGEWLLRELANNAQHRFNVIGFLDDDPLKIGKIIRGCRIYAPRDVPGLMERRPLANVLVSSRAISEQRLQAIRASGLQLLRMRVSFEYEEPSPADAGAPLCTGEPAAAPGVFEAASADFAHEKLAGSPDASAFQAKAR